MLGRLGIWGPHPLAFLFGVMSSSMGRLHVSVGHMVGVSVREGEDIMGNVGGGVSGREGVSIKVPHKEDIGFGGYTGTGLI